MTLVIERCDWVREAFVLNQLFQEATKKVGYSLCSCRFVIAEDTEDECLFLVVQRPQVINDNRGQDGLSNTC